MRCYFLSILIVSTLKRDEFLYVVNEVDDPDFFVLQVPGSFFIWLQDQFGDYPLEPGKSVLKLIFLSVSYKLNQFLNWF